MPTEDRYSSWSTRGKIVEFDDVDRLGRYASHHSADGHFYEYDLGVFWRTDLSADSPARQPLDDVAFLPPGPWHHLPGCDCEVCDDA